MTEQDSTENTPTTDCPDWCNRTHIDGVHSSDLILSDEGPAGVAIYTRLVDQGGGNPGIEVIVADLTSREAHRVVVNAANVQEHIRLQLEMERELFALIDGHENGSGQ